MSNLIYRRMAGYVFALGLHGINSIVILKTLWPPKTKDLKDISDLQWQFFTIWNVAFQLVYSSFGLTVDILTLTQPSEKTNSLISLREKIYSVIIWTSGFVVATIFWPVFFINRGLVYPEFIDEGIPPRSNYVMHGWILVVLLWEFLHLPRYERISHKKSLVVVSLLFATYFVWVIYSHSVSGLWPYPFLKMVWGTIYLPPIVVALYVIVVVSYFHQWPLVQLVWGKPATKVN